MAEEWVAYHEAGHAVAARALRRRVTLVTAEPGERWAGCCLAYARPVRAKLPSVDTPFATWPSGYQASLAGDVIVAMAGELAELMFMAREAGRVAESPGAAQSAGLAELAGGASAASAEERHQAAGAVNAEFMTDTEYVEHVTFTGFGSDWLRGLAWRGWLEQEAAEILRANGAAVRRMAALLMRHGVVGEKAAAAALKGVAR